MKRLLSRSIGACASRAGDRTTGEILAADEGELDADGWAHVAD
jgi:hypothetical protein